LWHSWWIRMWTRLLRNNWISYIHSPLSYVINFCTLLHHVSIIRILFVFGQITQLIIRIRPNTKIHYSVQPYRKSYHTDRHNNNNKYQNYFQPITLQFLGPMNCIAHRFLSDLGRRISRSSGDDRDTSFLFQRISVLLFSLILFCYTTTICWMTTWSIRLSIIFHIYYGNHGKHIYQQAWRHDSVHLLLVYLCESVKHPAVCLLLFQSLFTQLVASDDDLLASWLVLRVALQDCAEVGQSTLVIT